MSPEITAALEYWEEVNKLSNSWAALRIERFPHVLIAEVKVGYAYYKGTNRERKEIPTKTRNFFLTGGKVVHYDHYHV